MSTRRGVAVALLAVAALTGCDSSVDTASRASPTSSLRTPSSAAPHSTAPTDEPSAAGLEITAENIIEVVTSRMTEAGSVHMAMRNEVAGLILEGDVEFTGATANQRLTMTMTNLGTFEMLVVDGVTFVDGGATQGKYFAYEAGDPDNPFAGTTQGFDPTGTMRGLADAITSVTEGNATNLGGASVRAYDVQIDTTKLDARQLEGSALPDSMTYTYWIDDDGLLYSVQIDVAGTQVTVSYSHWGENFAIEAPAASEITDVPPF